MAAKFPRGESTDHWAIAFESLILWVSPKQIPRGSQIVVEEVGKQVWRTGLFLWLVTVQIQAGAVGVIAGAALLSEK